jgi:hypothetical protein
MFYAHLLLPGLRGSRFRWGFLAIAAIETIHAARRVYQLLLAGKKRVARRTNFHVQIVLLGRARFESFATRAGDRYFFIFWVNSGFHFSRYLIQMSFNRSDQTSHDTGRGRGSSSSGFHG